MLKPHLRNRIGYHLMTVAGILIAIHLFLYPEGDWLIYLAILISISTIAHKLTESPEERKRTLKITLTALLLALALVLYLLYKSQNWNG